MYIYWEEYYHIIWKQWMNEFIINSISDYFVQSMVNTKVAAIKTNEWVECMNWAGWLSWCRSSHQRIRNMSRDLGGTFFNAAKQNFTLKIRLLAVSLTCIIITNRSSSGRTCWNGLIYRMWTYEGFGPFLWIMSKISTQMPIDREKMRITQQTTNHNIAAIMLYFHSASRFEYSIFEGIQWMSLPIIHQINADLLVSLSFCALNWVELFLTKTKQFCCWQNRRWKYGSQTMRSLCSFSTFSFVFRKTHRHRNGIGKKTYGHNAVQLVLIV